MYPVRPESGKDLRETSRITRICVYMGALVQVPKFWYEQSCHRVQLLHGPGHHTTNVRNVMKLTYCLTWHFIHDKSKEKITFFLFESFQFTENVSECTRFTRRPLPLTSETPKFPVREGYCNCKERNWFSYLKRKVGLSDGIENSNIESLQDDKGTSRRRVTFFCRDSTNDKDLFRFTYTRI